MISRNKLLVVRERVFIILHLHDPASVDTWSIPGHIPGFRPTRIDVLFETLASLSWDLS